MSTENNDLGRVADGDQALVSDEAATHLRPAGFDPSRGAWLILAAQSLAMRYVVEAHHMDFEIYDAAESWRAGESVGSWSLFDGSEAYDFEDFEKADWELRGGLKWDGCINWETNPNCMYHGCGPSHVGHVAAIFQAVYAVGKRHFDLLEEEVDSLPEGAFDLIGGAAQGMDTGTAETLAAPGEA